MSAGRRTDLHARSSLLRRPGPRGWGEPAAWRGGNRDAAKRAAVHAGGGGGSGRGCGWGGGRHGWGGRRGGGGGGGRQVFLGGAFFFFFFRGGGGAGEPAFGGGGGAGGSCGGGRRGGFCWGVGGGGGSGGARAPAAGDGDLPEAHSQPIETVRQPRRACFTPRRTLRDPPGCAALLLFPAGGLRRRPAEGATPR